MGFEMFQLNHTKTIFDIVMKLNLPSVHHVFKIHIFLSEGLEDAMEILAIFLHSFCIYLVWTI